MNNDIILRRVLFTPELARKTLENNFDLQRNVRKSTVDIYASDMIRGEWNQRIGFVDNPVVISSKGHLLQGQHRLHAVIQSNCSVYMYVQYDADERNYMYYDNACRRTAADQLQSVDIAAVAKLACATEYGDTPVASAVQGKISPKFGPSRSWTIQYAQEHDLTAVVKTGKKMCRVMGVGGPAIYSYFVWLLKWLKRDDNLNEFINDFVSSPSTSKTIAALKERIWKTKGSRTDKLDKTSMLGLLLNAYEHFSLKDDKTMLNKYAPVLQRYSSLISMKRDESRKEGGAA